MITIATSALPAPSQGIAESQERSARASAGAQPTLRPLSIMNSQGSLGIAKRILATRASLAGGEPLSFGSFGRWEPSARPAMPNAGRQVGNDPSPGFVELLATLERCEGATGMPSTTR